jgi:hypothetical protein
VQLHRARTDDVERVGVEDLGRQRGGFLLGAGLLGTCADARPVQAHDRAAERLAALIGDRLLEQLGEQLEVVLECGRAVSAT